MSTPAQADPISVVNVNVDVNKLKLPNGDMAVQLIVSSGILQTSLTLNTEGAKGLARALQQQAEACEAAIVIPEKSVIGPD